ncbi:MAG: hypothetical protein MNPFHGCM_01355 [Gemmatimonadaceae bacterium]|nr:hypothetical protein [Gemmatimonadaceae bacterium]
MKIYDRNLGPLQPQRHQVDSREKDSPPGERAPRILPERPSDRVELSPAARELAKQALHRLRGNAANPDASAREVVKDAIHALPADARDRLQQVRQRVLSGAYNIDHVVTEVAQRILDRGDV